MHFHAEHSLFFERPQQLWRPALSLMLTVCVLVVNAGVGSTLVSAIGSGVGMFLLFIAYMRGHRRMEPAMAWTVTLVGFALLASVALGGDLSLFAEAAARVSCGVLWILWLGTRLDWSSFRQLLLRSRVPGSVVGSLDHAVIHGVLTQDEWLRRRDAARLRLGRSRLPLPVWGRLLGEGALGGFFRLESAEENALLRGSGHVSSVHGDVLRLDEVSVKRGEHVVLEQLELRMTAGEWMLLCGPSGAGKSSLLRLLSGLEEPAKGAMTRLGVTVSPDTALPARLDGRVALLSQNPEHHFIASTVAEDIAWGMLRRGVEANEARHRSEEMAKAMHVAHLLARPCHALSFGEQRRVALAGLLVLEPSLLLLDEPTSGLDPVASYELRKLVEEVVKETGAACIWATHDLHSLPPQATRTVLLRDGRVVFDGPTDEGVTKQWLVRAGLVAPQESETSC